jgi:NADH-quinone oxidoreductase subunit J
MNILFYIAASVAVLSTVLAISRLNAVHALLYMAVSLMAVSVVFLTFGALFAAALEVLIYAGAIVVLLIFVVMMLNQGPVTLREERDWLQPGMWIGPGILSLILLGELGTIFFQTPETGLAGRAVEPKAVGMALFGPYAIGVELASLLLLAGLVAACHLGRGEELKKSEEESGK